MRLQRAKFIWMVLALLTMGNTGCALFGGGGGADLKKNTNYKTSPPDSWKPLDRADSDEAYTLSEDTIATLTSSCGKNTDVPLEVLTKHLLIGSRNVSIRKRERLKVDGTEGLLTDVKATFEKKPFHLLLFVLPKEGCVFDFSLMSPREIQPSDRTNFTNYLQSFHYGTD